MWRENERFFRPGRQLIIIYQAKSGKWTKRTITVFAVRKRDVLAFCHVRNNLRTFKKENILAVHPITYKMGVYV